MHTTRLIPPVSPQSLDTNGDAAAWDIGASQNLTLQVAGTFTGTLTFEATADAMTWFAISLVKLGTGATSTTTTSTGQFSLPNSGLVGFRVRATDAMTGSAQVTLTAGANTPLVSGTGGNGGTSSTFGDPFPATGTAVGFKDSTGLLMAAGNLDASGNLKVSSSPTAAGTATLSNVSDSATSVTVLASNASRLAFELYNDSDASVFIKFGATASATSFLAKMLPSGFLSSRDIGANYTGRIDGIWSSAAGGAMRVTELTS